MARHRNTSAGSQGGVSIGLLSFFPRAPMPPLLLSPSELPRRRLRDVDTGQGDRDGAQADDGDLRLAVAEKAPASHDRVKDGVDAACRGGAGRWRRRLGIKLRVARCRFAELRVWVGVTDAEEGGGGLEGWPGAMADRRRM
jgi:hypothetical protein